MLTPERLDEGEEEEKNKFSTVNNNLFVFSHSFFLLSKQKNTHAHTNNLESIRLSYIKREKLIYGIYTKQKKKEKRKR
jgi:hypothetical protein